MTDILRHFSLSQNNNKKNNDEQSNSDIKEKNTLNYEIAQAMIELGYNIEQLMNLVKVSEIESVEDAVYLLSKDPETNKYMHVFYNPKKENNLISSESKCLICGHSISEHIENDYEINNKKDENSKNKISNSIVADNIISVNNNADKTDGPLLTESKSNFKQLNKTSTRSNHNPELKIKSIVIPPETLDLFDSPDVCRICFTNKIDEQNGYKSSCGHNFCKDCIVAYLKHKIMNGDVMEISCLMGGCPKKFTDEEIEMFVDKDLYIKYKRFKNYQMKISCPGKQYSQCPYPDCEELVEFSEFPDNLNSPIVKCAKNHVFCLICRQLGKHKKSECKKDKILEEIQKCNENGKNFKQCPNCGVIIEKNEGCNQMHCTNCGYNFCWLCLKEYSSSHYALYNARGCPGMRYESEIGSRWTKSPCLKCLWYLFSCFLGFLALILIFLFYLFFGCAYEFIQCYSQSNNKENDNLSSHISDDVIVEEQHNNSRSSNVEDGTKKEKSMWIICLLGFLGILCQPLYILFFVLYGLMECYRRFNCWFYYVDY